MTTTYAIPLRTRFRGIEVRQGMLWQGPAGWAEWSPFLDYSGPELRPWLAAAREAAELGFPAPVRATVPVNVTIPILPPEQARQLAADSGCRTAKIKVADPREDFAADLARIEAVRDGLGPGGRLRVDVNGAWDVDTAERHLRVLTKYDLEYAEQPVGTVEELAELRRRLLRAGVSVPIAADESIRRAEDPQRVKELAAADVAVLKVQPLGGVRRCLELAEDLGLPVVVSSALETSVGLAAGVALAAALPELPYACGLNTGALLTDDVVARPLRAVDGQIAVGPVEVDQAALQRCRADAATHQWWLRRREETAG
ncbi:o-succinylbenzoate synthase [Granulicoccus phenolivorans]|uniref:o-succinylbenzoate synthase n=1 Tax=Granulicoccus phenolivorans TaxID=266854 RepID=UPI000401EBC0|nr:o-succinylbenzoate synthase [Granulicoccus phenolivorans]